MDDFGKRMRDKVQSTHGRLLEETLEDVKLWIENEIMPNLETEMEKAADRGKDRVLFRHPYTTGYRPEVHEIEKSPSYQFFKATCEKLGLEHVVMSHKALGRDPKLYPCIELLVVIPSRWRDTERARLPDHI